MKNIIIYLLSFLLAAGLSFGVVTFVKQKEAKAEKERQELVERQQREEAARRAYEEAKRLELEEQARLEAEAEAAKATTAKTETSKQPATQKQETKPLPPVEKLSAGEIASIINSGNADNIRPVQDRIAKKVRVSCNVEGVNSINSACSRAYMDDLSASVSNLKYDETGRLTSLTITLNERD